MHALLGENGAGKTTLMHVLYGIEQPDSGEIWVEGARVQMDSPRAALAHGIALVAQHFTLIGALSVAENLALGDARAPATGRALREWAAERLRAAELELDPDTPAERLSLGQSQRLEIARALARGARVLILDEPTAVLAPPEVDRLLAFVVQLRASGRTVVFISHKLSEITRVCDRVTVLREGRSVGTRPAAGAGAEQLARWMIGEGGEIPLAPETRASPSPAEGGAAPPEARSHPRAAGDVALRLRGLSCPGLSGAELTLRRGEIVGIAGIDGNGQRELEELLAGVRTASAGVIELHGPPLALLSADRQRTGLALELSVAENLALPAAARGGTEPPYRGGWLQRGALAECARAALQPFALRGELGARARLLSGGNQQKLALARWLQGEPGVLVAAQPTRGLDVRSAARVRALVRERAAAGAAILVISSDLDEVLELCERVAVLFRGALLHVPAGAALRERVGRAMLGVAEG